MVWGPSQKYMWIKICSMCCMSALTLHAVYLPTHRKNHLTHVVCAGNKHQAYEIMIIFTRKPNYNILSKYRAVCVLFILVSAVISL